MATFSQNQVKDIAVGTQMASETTAKTFIADASVLEVALLDSTGSQNPTEGQDFYLVSKHADGTSKTSDVVVGGQISYINIVDTKTAVLKSYSLSIPAIGNFATGDILQIQITLDNWGSLSFEDQYLKYGFYKVLAGDGVEEIVDGLIASLVRNFSREEPKVTTQDPVDTYGLVATLFHATLATAKINAFAMVTADTVLLGDYVRVYDGATEDKVWVVSDVDGVDFAASFTEVADYEAAYVNANPLFTFAKVATVGGVFALTITEKVQEYVTGKKQGRPLEFVVSNDFDSTQTVTQRVINPTSGKAIRDLEYFCKGNVGDGYRGAGYPHNFEAEYDSVLATDYYLVQIGFWFEGGNHAVQKSEKELVVALSDKTSANAFAVLLETATGLTLPSFA